MGVLLCHIKEVSYLMQQSEHRFGNPEGTGLILGRAMLKVGTVKVGTLKVGNVYSGMLCNHNKIGQCFQYNRQINFKYKWHRTTQTHL